MNKKKCLEAIQLLARISAADDNGYCQCVSCGTIRHFRDNMDGGHFVPKGNSSFWALEVENVHPQCKYCNIFGMKSGTAAQEYTKWMYDYYGKDFVDNMLATKRNPIKRYKKDYEELYRGFMEQIKEHQERIGEA